jgi:glycosyltransferase involved in cell wall biosynthesis
MKILHLGPLWFPVSRDAAGGRETSLAGLIGELQKRGCHNTLLAAGDSLTAAELVPVIPRNLMALMAEGTAGEMLFYREHQRMLALARAPEFDVIHSHLTPNVFSLSAVPGIGPRVLHTQHTPVWQDLEWFVGRHPDLWINTVSEFQARKLQAAGARRCFVVHNGIEVDSFAFQAGGAGLVFLGRIESGKGPDLAVEIARQLGLPLKLAGPVIDQGLFEKAIQPYLGDQIQYIGVVNHAQKNELFGQAGCALLPFRGAEGFGLVSVEAMACGTPVVALGNGALPEIVEPGLTGYLAARPEELPELVQSAQKLERAAVRQRVKMRFDLPVMADRYLKLYEQIVANA